MPNAALVLMGSPMLLAPLPPQIQPDVAIATPMPAFASIEAPSQRPTDAQGNVSLIPLSYSLVVSQTPLQEGQSSQEPQDAQGAQSEQDGPQTENPEPENTSQQNAGETDGIIVRGQYGPPDSDPVAVFNERSFRITQDLDAALVEPVAYAYRDGLPDPLRDGLGNAVRNLGEPVNFLNFLLQGKFGKAAETLGRFAINSTLGLGGLIDIAEKPGIGLPYRRNGFANTLGYYGVEPGAYLYLPVTGATTVRDLFGNTLDQLVLPTAIGAPFNTPEYAIPYFLVSNLDARLEFDEEIGRVDNAIDPYAARRDSYLARRERDLALLRGEEPPEPPAILREIEEGIIEDEDYDDGEEALIEPDQSVDAALIANPQEVSSASDDSQSESAIDQEQILITQTPQGR